MTFNNSVHKSQRWQDVVQEVDPELKHLVKRLPPLQVKSWMLGLIPSINLFLRCSPAQVPKDIRYKSIRNLGIYLQPKNICTPNNLQGAAILWMHGGGRIMGHPKMDLKLVSARIVQQTGVPLFSVNYRFDFPGALDDCLEAYEWLLQQESIDRVIVAGESAGGGLAAELCQRLYDTHKEEQQPVAQVLVYPMLDDRTCLDEHKTQQKYLLWNNRGNNIGWSSYLGPTYKPGDEELPKYAAAARRKDLSGLPPALVVACSLDLFRDEDEAYARRLEDAGVEIQYEEIEGGFHGILTWGTTEAPVVRIYDDLASFVKRHLIR